jgi:6-phospho 3-hexuloisomerase
MPPDLTARNRDDPIGGPSRGRAPDRVRTVEFAAGHLRDERGRPARKEVAVVEPTDAEESTFVRAQRFIGERVTKALERVDAVAVDHAVEILGSARQTFVYGAGRSGIIGRAFAMRLVQTGLRAYVIGESVTPIVSPGDAVFILSGQGESYSSIQTANIVRREGANLIVLTARPTSKLAHTATLLLAVEFPENGDRPRYAPLGTLFESASLRLTDAIIAELMAMRGESEATMRRRHAIIV